MSPTNRHPACGTPAFSLTEMVAAMAVLVILLATGRVVMDGAGSRARQTGTDLLTAMIEQARTAAITSRSCVVLAVAEPGDLPVADERCRLGLFKVARWPDPATDPVMGELICRWRCLETGIVLIGGEVDGVANPLDANQLTISYGATQQLAARVHAIAFNARGGLLYPVGSSPVAMRIAEGRYRAGKATPNRRGNTAAITENRLQIGRVNARPYRIDG